MHRKGLRLLSCAFALVLALSLFAFPQPAKADVSMQAIGAAPGMDSYRVSSTKLQELDGQLYLAAGMAPTVSYGTTIYYLCIYRWDGESAGWAQIGSFGTENLDNLTIEFACNGSSLFAAYREGNSIYVNECANPADASPTWSLVDSSSFSVAFGQMELAADGDMLYLAVGGSDYNAYLYSYDTASSTGWAMVGGSAIGSANGSSVALTIHNGSPYVAYKDSYWLNGTVVKTYADGAWSTYWSSMEVYWPETIALDGDDNLYLCGAQYNYETSDYEEKFFVNDSSGLHTYSGILGRQAGPSRLFVTSASDVYLACNVYDTVFFGRFDGQSVTSLYSYPSGSNDVPDVIWYGGTLVMSHPSGTGKAAVSRYVTDYTLTAAQVAVTNNTGSADTVSVTGIAAGDRVAVYADSSCTDLLGTAFVAAGATSITASIDQLGSDAGTVYVTRSHGINWTPAPVAVEYDQEVPLPITVTFDSQGGSAVPSQQVVPNGLVTKPTNPTWTGHTFGGWYKQAACTSAWNFATDRVTANTTIYAKWTVNAPMTYAVAVSANNGAWGTVSGAGSYAAGATATVKATPKAGYRFVRWLEGSTAVSTNASYAFPVTKARTLKAEFAAIATPALTVKTTTTTGATLSWTAVAGATGYEVYRDGVRVDLVTGTTYTAKGLSVGKAYLYKIRARCAATTATTYSAYSTTVVVRPLPAAPAGVKAASAGYSSAKVSWNAVTGATKYQVYRATSASGSYTYLGETAATNYTNTGLTTGKTYSYKVRAYSMVGTVKVTGAYSAVVSAKPVPATPTGVAATRVSNSSLKVSWSKVSGATGYQVYRATSSGGTYTKIKETTSLSYTNTGLTDNKTYYYKVRAYRTVSTTKVYGAYSAIVYAKP